MSREKSLDKIYFQLIGLDFDTLSFANHIALDEAIEELRQLREEVLQEDLPPPLPAHLSETTDGNLLLFRKKNHDTNLKIMILDEDIEMQSLVSFALKGEDDVTVLCERSPLNALETLVRSKPDVIMVDVMMKEMSCFDFIHDLHKLDPEHTIDLIIGSFNPNQHEKHAAFEMGAVDYITRPYDLSEVRFKVRLRLASKRKLCG